LYSHEFFCFNLVNKSSITFLYPFNKFLINLQKQELWKLKQISSENEKNKNLLQGYKKVLEELTDKLIRKDS